MEALLEYANDIAALIGENCEVKEVEKTNGVKKIGIMIKQGNICPTIYVEEMFERNMPVDEAAETVRMLAEKNRIDDTSITQKFADYEGFVKPNLRAKLLNKKNRNGISRSAAFYGFRDLIIVPIINVEIEGMGGSITVQKEHLETWGVTESEVIDQALENIKADVRIENIFKFLGAPEEIVNRDDIPDISYVTNCNNNYGAVAILGALDTLKAKHPNGFYCIPASVHEFIVYPTLAGHSEIEVKEMIKNVNKTCVEAEDYLSNELYFIG